MAAKAAHGTKIVVIDPRRTATADAADLHLPIAPGSDIALFNGLLAYLDATGAIDRRCVATTPPDLRRDCRAPRSARTSIDRRPRECGVDPEFSRLLRLVRQDRTRAVTVFLRASTSPPPAPTRSTRSSTAISPPDASAGRACGPFSVTGQPNAMGGREVGGLANQLAAHMGFDDAGGP